MGIFIFAMPDAQTAVPNISIKYTERLAEAGIEPSVGSVGDGKERAVECGAITVSEFNQPGLKDQAKLNISRGRELYRDGRDHRKYRPAARSQLLAISRAISTIMSSCPPTILRLPTSARMARVSMP